MSHLGCSSFSQQMKQEFEEQKNKDAASITRFREHISLSKMELSVVTLLREALMSQAGIRRKLLEQDNRGVNDISALQVTLTVKTARRCCPCHIRVRLLLLWWWWWWWWWW